MAFTRRAFSVAIGLSTFVMHAAAAQQVSPAHKHAWIISGGASFVHSDDDSPAPARTSISLVPTALDFVTDHLAFGASAQLSWSGSDASHTTGLGLGPSVRYYFSGPQQTLLPFVSASILPTRTTFSAPSLPDVTSTQLASDLSAGLTQVIASHVGVTGEAFYARRRATQSGVSGHDVTVHVTDFGLRFGLTMFVR